MIHILQINIQQSAIAPKLLAQFAAEIKADLVVSEKYRNNQSINYQFRRDTEFSHGRVQFYPDYAIKGGLEVDEKMVQLMSICHQFFHHMPHPENLICC